MAQRFIKLSYRMFSHTPASHKLLYETEVTRPESFVTDMGLMMDSFEQRVAALRPGESFDFVLEAEEAFGMRDEQLVRAVPRKMFEINGKFIADEVFPGAQVPLMDNEGNHFYGTIVQVTGTEVTVDLNHPLAGKALQFTGTVHENREATLKEIEQTAKILSGEGCQGCCGEGGGCDSGCGSGGCCGGQGGCCGDAS